NPDQTEYFVGLVDAYRQSIWNRPFNKALNQELTDKATVPHIETNLK
ncbi:unnamed protein product, partial [marine sediment metagenome]